MLETSSIFAIFRKIFVVIHLWYMLWMRLVHRYTLIFFSKFFVEKYVLKRIRYEIFNISGHYWGHIGQKPVPYWTEPLWGEKIKQKFWKNSGTEQSNRIWPRNQLFFFVVFFYSTFDCVDRDNFNQRQISVRARAFVYLKNSSIVSIKKSRKITVESHLI